jgi:hypothetical protein
MKDLRSCLLMFKRLKESLLKNKISAKFLFIIMGIASTAWFLIRVIPKPQRAGYPCMRAAAPIMSGFIIYILSLGGLTILFKKSIANLKRARYWSALFAFVLGLVLLVAFNTRNVEKIFANTTAFTRGVLPDAPNSPVGEGNGIFPGRVAWSYNAAATDETCTNSITDAYFMASNTNQNIINSMANQTIKSIGGENTVSEAWDAIFKNFNEKKTGSGTGYAAGQKIFIKMNNGQAGWAIDASLALTGQHSSGTGQNNIAMANTSPQAVLAFLVQLIDSCDVAQGDIMIGEPMTHVYKSMYDIVHPIYPDVKLMDKEDHVALGRTTSSGWQSGVIVFSDKGHVMPIAIEDDMMNEMYNADYLINISALKAHARAGVTFCAKNHFGSSSHGGSYGAEPLHNGLISTQGNDVMTTGLRGDYHMYRVLTDLMGNENLGGNTVLFVVDGLWGGIEACDMPVKWETAPFNNDFPSSLFVSQDEIAVESVCIDFLRAEANVNSYFSDRPFFPAVDDFLHQGATKANWPDSIKNLSNNWYAFAGYDPEGDGTYMPSLGIHEHWNNSTDKQYSRNLFTNGTGIELVSFPANLVAYNNETAFNLTITVTDGSDPLQDAIIVVNGSNYITDSDGKVIIGDLTTVIGLSYSISKEDYNTYTGQVDISADKEISIDLSKGTVGIFNTGSASQVSISAYPNPMTIECEISYTLKSDATISLFITSIDGKIIEQLQQGKVSEGNHTQKFSAEKLKSGLYLCVLRVQYGDKSEIKTIKLKVL